MAAQNSFITDVLQAPKCAAAKCAAELFLTEVQSN